MDLTVAPRRWFLRSRSSPSFRAPIVRLPCYPSPRTSSEERHARHGIVIDRTTLRVAFRTLGRHKGFTTVAILSLGIAIALNTTMYSVLDAMIRPRINARSPQNIWEMRFYANDARKLDYASVERALRSGAPGYDGVTGMDFIPGQFRGTLVENGSHYKRVSLTIVRPNYFTFLGSQALQGRLFAPYDSTSGTTNAVISDRLASKLFPDESPVGRSITVEGNGYTVIGVIERSSVFYPLGADIWVLRPPKHRPTPISLMRLTEGVDDKTLRASLGTIAAQITLESGEPVGSMGFYLKHFETRQFRIEGFHFALFGAVGAVLLVACANLANLQLARGLARSRELALRSAVGASRRQLIQHLVLESGILAFAGLVLGIILTLWGAWLVKSSVPPEITDYMIEPQTSWRMFAFASLAAMVCLFLVGLLPALHVSRVDPDSLLKSSSGTGANKQHRRRYGMMVVAQIGFALPVLVGATVVLQAAFKMRSREYLGRERYGFNPAPLVAGSVNLLSDTVGAVKVTSLAAELVGRTKSMTGVVEAAAAYSLQPVKRMVTVDDENGVVREEAANQWGYDVVTPAYFRTLGIGMERGRDFRENEFARSVIMDAGSARFLWGQRNPVGRAIKFGNAQSSEPWYRVIGITKDQRDTATIRRMNYSYGYRLTEVSRVIAPLDSVLLSRRRWWSMTLYARVQGNTELAAVRLQRTLRAMPSGERPSVTPIVDEWLQYSKTRQDFVAALFSTFAFLGLSLVAVGVYGIVSHSIAERRRELAVRISLGAGARNILHSVLREGNALILAGIAFGLLFTKYTVWWLSNFMDENAGYDALLFAAIATGLFALAAFAAFLPALRATRIDPVDALRHE